MFLSVLTYENSELKYIINAPFLLCQRNRTPARLHPCFLYDKFILIKDLQSLNIPDIFMTFSVLNEDKFISSKEVQ